MVLLIVSSLINASFSRSIIFPGDSEDIIRSIFADRNGGTESLSEVPVGAQRRIAAAPRLRQTFRTWYIYIYTNCKSRSNF